jgi:hypothetical protein
MEELIDGDNIEASVENLYNVAMEHGGTDNITNILIKITESTNPTSSFKDVGPKRNKPRNPDFETTNAMQGGNEVEEDYPVEKPKRKMLWIGIAASLTIIVGVYFLFFNKPNIEIDNPGAEVPKGEEKTITTQDIENKDEAEMDIFIAELNNGKEYVCKDCKSEYKKGKASYVLTRAHESITKGIKKIGNDVIEVKCAHGVTGKCTQCNPPTVLKCAHGNDKKSCGDCNKPVNPDKCSHGKIKKDCSACTTKPPTGKTPVTVTIKAGEAYSKLQNAADAKCGKGKINMDDWSPKIKSATDMKPATYTCDCPQ